MLRYTIILIFFSLSGFAQPKADSLENVAVKAPDDSVKVLLLNNYVSAIRENDNNRALRYAIIAKDLALKLSFERGLGYVYENMGWIYYRKGDYSKSMEISAKALVINQKYGNKAEMGNSLNNIAAVYFEQKQFHQAISTFKKAYKFGVECDDISIKSRSLNNIAFSYLSLHMLDSAEAYSQRAIRNSEGKDRFRTAFSKRTLADIYAEKKDYPNAIKNYEFALREGELLGNNFMKASTLHRIANVYIKLHDLDKALYYLKQNVELTKKYGYGNELEKTYQLLATAYEMQRDKSKAYEFQSEYVKLHDSIFSQRSNQQITLIQARYEAEIKQAQIDLLTKAATIKEKEIKDQKDWIYFFAGIMTLLCLLVFVLVSNNNRSKAANHALEEKNVQINLQAQELRDLNATKDKLFSIISHDLRSPVSSLRGLMDLISKERLTQEEFIEVSKTLKHNLDYVHEDLDNLLNWARSQLKGFEPVLINNNLHELVVEKINLFSEAAKAKGISFQNDVKESLEVFADKNHLGLVLRNLIGNALKFNRPGGTVRISALIKGRNIDISVSDSGTGMTDEEMQKLFRAETHFSKPGTNKEKGMGLGLLLVKEFIERNGGTIAVKSVLGSGSTFTFSLKGSFIPQDVSRQAYAS